MRSSPPPVPVRIGLADDHADAIAAAAARIGTTVEVRNAGPGRTRIGDVTLPARPDPWLLEAALLRSLAPRHILFLCVANSARSQLAEGIARSLAAPEVTISSAGSAPTSVRPQAIEVLREIDIDISEHRSSSIDEVDDPVDADGAVAAVDGDGAVSPVDAVITLCAEEVCPVWLGSAWRLHWGLPDPAAVEGSEHAKLDAFRSVRDELTKRLSVLLGPTPGP